MNAFKVSSTGLLAMLMLASTLSPLAEARGFAGGGMRGGGFDRGGGGFDHGGGDFNHNVNVDHSANVNVNRNVNVNSSYHSGWNGDYHPVATGLAVGAGVALTAAAIGSIAYSLPPSCGMVAVGGVSYQQCGSTWYQPHYVGTQVQYIVVNPPN